MYLCLESGTQVACSSISLKPKQVCFGGDIFQGGSLMALPTTQSSMSHRSRPFGIAIIAFLLLLSGILDLTIVVLGIFAVVAWHIHFAPPRLSETDQLSEVPAVAILLALAFLPLLLARGLWHLRPWAYHGLVLLESANVAFGVLSLINRQPEKQTIALLVLPVLILLYLLFDHRVHVAFSR
jgi:hypothetical protein